MMLEIVNNVHYTPRATIWASTASSFSATGTASANQKHYAQVFYQACVNGDFELAASMLRCGVNLNVKFENGESLLHIACAKSFYG